MKTTRTSAQFVSLLTIGLALLFGWPGLALRQSAASRTSVATATVFTTITVDTTDDTVAADGKCSLREAIEAANTDTAVDTCAAGSGADTIEFNLGTGTPTITLTSALPSIDSSVTINGATGGATRVELNGAGLGADGLVIHASSTIRGLVINRFGGSAIHLEGGAGSGIKNCYLGTDATGTVDLGNNGYGVYINTSANNTIGGTTAGDRNIISGNDSSGVQIFNTAATGNIVSGNYIGVDATGSVDLGNEVAGVVVAAPNNMIGGTLAGARNLISGNNQYGIVIQNTGGGGGNKVQGNYIGTNAAGTEAIGNKVGVAVQDLSNNYIGGPAAGEGNLISGNNENGVQIEGASATGNLIQGNYIGVNAAGTAALGNGLNGLIVFNAANTQIGGTAAGAGNLISANGQSGIVISQAGASNSQIQGNIIGTDINGTLDLGNAGSGIYIEFASTNIIGGTSTGARNLVSGNNGHGIHLRFPQSTNNTLQGNYIGTNAAGTLAIPNSQYGVLVEESPNNLIGGTAAGARNLISGNTGFGVLIGSGAAGNQVLGNYIGVNANGDAALGNLAAGVVAGGGSNNCIIGGTAAGARNVISANRSGINVDDLTTGTQILGNFIGTNAAGTAALGNLEIGVSFDGDNTIIGGTTSGARNVISGNGGVGIQGGGDNVTIQGNYIGTDVTGTVALPHAREGIFLTSSNSLIGGTTAAARNLISGNSGAGIGLAFTATNNQVQGNYIGTNAAGTAALPNGAGVAIVEGAHDNFIGGTAAGTRNVISGNNDVGIAFYIRGNNNTVQGNFIGVNAAGTAPLPNGNNGIHAIISSGNIIGGTAAGAANRIAYNGQAGVAVFDDASNPSVNNRILANHIFANGSLGIELLPYGVTANDAGDGDIGPNNLQNFPVLDPITTVGTVSGSLDSTAANSAYPIRIEFFANAACDSSGNGEGEVFLGAASIGAPGSFTFNYAPVGGKIFITATATDASGNTSEFSACSQQPVNDPPTINGATITVQKGSVNSTQQIATVNDANQTEETLTVKLNGGSSATSDGVTVSGLSVDSSGNVTASVTATCDATTTPPRTFTLTVTDNGSLSASATLTVNVTPNAKPALSYNDQTVVVGSTLTVNPATGPSDNGTFVVELDKVQPKTGISVAVDSVTGVVSITNVTKADMYKVDINITDNCNQKTSATFKVTVSALALAIRAVKNDFDGDRKSDLVDWNPESGAWRIRRSSDGELQIETWGVAGDRAVPADYDGDGKADLAVWRAAEGQWLIKRSSDGETLTVVLGERGDAPVPGDYDGDGKADAAIWRAGAGMWLIHRSSDAEEQRFAFGTGDEVAAPGDYDGDGKLDPALWRPSSGQWLIKLSGNDVELEFRWGTNGDVPVPADYDGDGRTDIAVWRSRTGVWMIRRSADGESQNVWCGRRAFGDAPVPGDYDGDGKADAAVWRAVEGAWYISDSAANLPLHQVRPGGRLH